MNKTRFQTEYTDSVSDETLKVSINQDPLKIKISFYDEASGEPERADGPSFVEYFGKTLLGVTGYYKPSGNIFHRVDGPAAYSRANGIKNFTVNGVEIASITQNGTIHRGDLFI